MGDSVKGLIQEAKKGYKFDAAVFSPPYNMGVEYDSYDDNLDTASYLKHSYEMASALKECATASSVVWLQMGPSMQNPSLPFAVLEEYAKAGWQLYNQIMWIKSGSFPQKDGSEASFGHYRPMNSRIYLHRSWEWVFMLALAGKTSVCLDKLALGVEYADKSNIERFHRTKDLRCRGNVWALPLEESPAHVITPEEAAWLACAIDSEGSIYLTKNHDRRTASVVYQLVVDLSNTNKAYIDQAKAISGGLGSLSSKKAHHGQGFDRQECFRCAWVGKQAAALLKVIRPYLVIKGRRADLGVLLDSSKGNRADRGYKTALSQETLDFRERCFVAMAKMNEKGKETDLDLSWVPVLPQLDKEKDQDFWVVPYKTTQKTSHPCPFPVKLVENCLKLQGLEGITNVLDPYCGTGATAQAASAHGKEFLGFELSQKYVDEALKRPLGDKVSVRHL